MPFYGSLGIPALDLRYSFSEVSLMIVARNVFRMRTDITDINGYHWVSGKFIAPLIFETSFKEEIIIPF